MKGNAAAVFVGLSLLGASGPMAAAPFQQGGLLILQPQNQTIAPPFSLPDEGDLLQFTDGSSLHGELKRIDAATGLTWDSPAANKPIAFRPARVESVRFARADSVTTTPTAHLRLANGDDVLGSVTTLDNDHLGFSTWFGGALTVPRSAVQSITFLSSNYTLLYEGPGDAEGWIVGNHNPESWILRDGTFISGFAGTLGRDFKLTHSSTIAFDLAWSDPFELAVNLYSDSVDRMDNSCYLLQMSRDQVNLRHVESPGAGPPRSLGSAPLHIPPGQSKVRVTIQSNKDEGTFAVYVDNVLAKRWKDDNGFDASGGGVFFQQAAVNSGVIKLSNISVSEWQGRYEPETSTAATNADVVRFINHDQAVGKIVGIDKGKITLALGETPLQIPIGRVTQINFAVTAQANVRGPWEVRAHFPRGGSISFQLENWSERGVSGHSDIFGSLAFQPGQIRQLEFNLGHDATTAPAPSHAQFEELDE